jgi:hypothetical protein
MVFAGSQRIIDAFYEVLGIHRTTSLIPIEQLYKLREPLSKLALPQVFRSNMFREVSSKQIEHVPKGVFQQPGLKRLQCSGN